MRLMLVALLLALATPSFAADWPERWSQPVEPFQIAERTWYVGTAGISALLIKTGAGAVLIDGGMPEHAPRLLENLKSLGIAPADLRLILFSHAHFDHTGALAALARASGATVVASAEGKALIERGGWDDLHFGDALVYAPLPVGRLVQDGETVELGGVRFTAHFTTGHTPGSLSWSWRDVVAGREVDVVYADSLTAPTYRLLDNSRFPKIVDAYRSSFAMLRTLPCDLLLTPHPEVSGLDPTAPGPSAERLDRKSCRAYADTAEKNLDQQLATERAKRKQEQG